MAAVTWTLQDQVTAQVVLTRVEIVAFAKQKAKTALQDANNATLVPDVESGSPTVSVTAQDTAGEVDSVTVDLSLSVNESSP